MLNFRKVEVIELIAEKLVKKISIETVIFIFFAPPLLKSKKEKDRQNKTEESITLHITNN